MKTSERDLLTKLKSVKQHDPVASVRNSLGAIKHVVGNPMMKAEINLSITTHFFNAAGVEIAPAALPLPMQTSLPVYLLGLTDYYGGFLKSLNIIPLTLPWQLFDFFGAPANFSGINQRSANPFIAGALPFVEYGDLILQYWNPITIDSCIVIVHCNNVAYGTFLNSFVSDLITIDRIRYFVPIANINQFLNPLVFANQTLFGKTDSDSVDPRLYITPGVFQQQIADIPLNLPIAKSVMLGFQLDVFCQQVNLVLFVNKVEPLTHRQTKIIR